MVAVAMVIALNPTKSNARGFSPPKPPAPPVCPSSPALPIDSGLALLVIGGLSMGVVAVTKSNSAIKNASAKA